MEEFFFILGIMGIILIIILIPGLYFSNRAKEYEPDLAKIESSDKEDKTIYYLTYKELIKIRQRLTIIVVVILIPIIIKLIMLTNLIDKLIKIEKILENIKI